MSSDDTDYYRQRAVDERAMALKAERRDVAAIHEELARQYQALVDYAELRPELRMVTRDRLPA
jgi:type II secretory pathway component PulC